MYGVENIKTNVFRLLYAIVVTGHREMQYAEYNPIL